MEEISRLKRMKVDHLVAVIVAETISIAETEAVKTPKAKVTIAVINSANKNMVALHWLLLLINIWDALLASSKRLIYLNAIPMERTSKIMTISSRKSLKEKLTIVISELLSPKNTVLIPSVI